MTATLTNLAERLWFYLPTLYPDQELVTLTERILAEIAPHALRETPDFQGVNLWDETTALIITYGDSLLPSASGDNRPPLTVLKEFLNTYLPGVISGVHILPFFPYSSDDGFAVIDYLQVNPKLGSWKDIQAIAANFDVMTDLVINHISSQSRWFQQFLRQEEPGCH